MTRKKNTSQIFSQNLKQLLKQKNLTQKQLSKMTKICPSVINDWCNGTVPYDHCRILKIAEVLDTDFQKLLTSVPSKREIPNDELCSTVHEIELPAGTYRIVLKKIIKNDLQRNSP